MNFYELNFCVTVSKKILTKEIFELIPMRVHSIFEKFLCSESYYDFPPNSSIFRIYKVQSSPQVISVYCDTSRSFYRYISPSFMNWGLFYCPFIILIEGNLKLKSHLYICKEQQKFMFCSCTIWELSSSFLIYSCNTRPVLDMFFFMKERHGY